MYWLVLLTVPAAALAVRPGVSVSRRVLACTLVLLVPVAGPLLAMLVRRARGGAVALEPDDEAPQPHLSPGDASRLGEQPPMLERLLCGDASERLAALVALSSAGDAQAVAVLRWTVEHGPSEVVLDAALTLEEIDLRNTARSRLAQDALEAGPTVETALAAARAAERSVLSRLADAAIAPMLATEARNCYQQALALASAGGHDLFDIQLGLAQLELASGRARAALDIAGTLVCRTQVQVEQVTALRDHAAFACRVHDALATIPCAPAHPSARRASGEIEVAPRKVSLPRRTTGVIQIREVAAAALLG
jgi:hypothetical protein